MKGKTVSQTLTAAVVSASIGLMVLAGPLLAASRWVPLPISKSDALTNAHLAGNPQRGAELFAGCQACHSIGSESAANGIGPDLSGIVGRPAAIYKGYDYSPAMRAAGKEGLIWTRDFLEEYLEDPTKFMPDGAMAFVGIADQQARDDLIAYLAGLKANEDAPWLIANLSKVEIPLPEQSPVNR